MERDSRHEDNLVIRISERVVHSPHHRLILPVLTAKSRTASHYLIVIRSITKVRITKFP